MLTSPELSPANGVSHGFFTRDGGVSDGIYASLNCGAGSGDRPENVRENKRRATAKLGCREDALVTLYQVHSAETVLVTDAATTAGNRPEADGMATDRRGIVLGILTADCAPVLFVDAANGVIGACHAGWRGALTGIIEATLSTMESIGAKRPSITAAVGPCIAQSSYQVGGEFPAPFLAADPANEQFFAPDTEDAGRFRFDLEGYVLARLGDAGVGSARPSGLDTYAEDNRFFSYRRTCHRGEDDYGRGLSAIVLTG